MKRFILFVIIGISVIIFSSNLNGQSDNYYIDGVSYCLKDSSKSKAKKLNIIETIDSLYMVSRYVDSCTMLLGTYKTDSIEYSSYFTISNEIGEFVYREDKSYFIVRHGLFFILSNSGILLRIEKWEDGELIGYFSIW